MLNEEHPDFGCKPGDKRKDSKGTVWQFGRNQHSCFWRAKPKDGVIGCSKDYLGDEWGSPYYVGGVYCRDFESAADRAKRNAKKEYERALEVVRRYESE